ncbi:DUF6069 family protein [Gordonia humi]|uniref:Uncharacterized protein n=1 Tax=Gordonia humi TaxID=686429 RepID=A0A840EZH1_9ACTN|nr:DUF6069 family protein [Gordonia humi]MBB4135734.1 hypothetical protein [Gordonia humi]
MTNYDPRDPRYGAPKQNPPTQAYSQANDYSYGYTEQQYQQPQYEQAHYDQAPAAPKRPARRGPDIDPLMFCGGVLMTGIVTGLAAWLVAWIIRTITQKVNDSGKLGIWNPLASDELWFAVAGFIVAIVAGALWYLLQIGTPAPDQFYRWVVVLLIAASVVIPLALSNEISTGIGTAVMHLIIGIPVLTLIPTMGTASRRKQQR